MGENMCGKNQKTRWSIKDILKPQMKKLKKHTWIYGKTQMKKLKTTNEDIENYKWRN